MASNPLPRFDVVPTPITNVGAATGEPFPASTTVAKAPPGAPPAPRVPPAGAGNAPSPVPGASAPNGFGTAANDPRLGAIEKQLDANDWRGIAAEYGTLEAIAALPPNLALIAALARHEAMPEGDHNSVLLAVRCLASLLGVPEESPLARVIARRMMRKNPVRFRDRKAPKTRTSIGIMVATLVYGLIIGWLLSGGTAELRSTLSGASTDILDFFQSRH